MKQERWNGPPLDSWGYMLQGQLYEPVDSDQFLYYKEAQDGQILEEGITRLVLFLLLLQQA